MENETIFTKVRQNINNYINGKTTISKYVEWSLYDTIEQIDAYINSKHISGETDHLGREKPFFNIVTAATNIWYRATDIDRKDIRLKTKRMSDILLTFIANIHLQDFMNKSNFGQFLNNWGRSLSKYGSSIIKFVERDGELYASVIPWNRLIVDSVNFDSDITIEKLYLSPSQLRRNKSYDKKMVEALIDAQSTRKTQDGVAIDNKSNYIEIYEIHGEMPLSWLTDNEEDDDEYVQQMQVISYVACEEEGKEVNKDFTLFKAKESKHPYMITHLIEEDGRILGIGAVEHLFQAQWMTNHSQKLIKDQLDLASKLVFQTSDPNFVGQNILTAIETGDILTHSPNQSLTQIANNSHDITSLQNFATVWNNQAKEITSTPDAISGATMPSGTAYRQVAVLNQEAHSLFEIMVENKSLALEQMLREFILPFIKKKMDTSEEISTSINSLGLYQIDKMYIDNQVAKIGNDLKKQTILSGKIFEGFNPEDIKSKLQDNLTSQGENRYFVPSDVSDTTWKELLNDFEWIPEVQISNENSNKEVIMTTLTTVLQTIANRQGQPFSPQEQLLFNKILEETGVVSSIELNSMPKEQPVQNTQTNIPPNTTPVDMNNLTPTTTS